MPKTMTCGSAGKATAFTYDGNVTLGVTLHFTTGDVPISPRFLSAIREKFAGRRVAGGFSVLAPPPLSFGAWVNDNSQALNGRRLTPRHGSFIAAVLRDAGWLKVELEGNAVYLRFPARTAGT